MEYIELAEKLREKAHELDSTLRGLTSVNTDLISKCDAALHALKGLKKSERKLCTVCHENELSHCFIPCGHTYCETCSTRGSRRGRCFACRGTIERAIKIYF